MPCLYNRNPAKIQLIIGDHFHRYLKDGNIGLYGSKKEINSDIGTALAISFIRSHAILEMDYKIG